MEINQLNQRPNLEQTNKLKKKYTQFEALIAALRERDLPADTIDRLNSEIDSLNRHSEADKAFSKQLAKAQSNIMKFLEKEHKIVPRNHYRNTWLAIGMAAFGIPMGVAFGTSMGNMAFLGIGLPIGMAIGIAVGTTMDQKAKENGLQLDLELQ